MKKKGFTLIELLAVLVILVIIMAITTPIILGIIDEARHTANLREIDFIIDGAETLQALSVIQDEDIKFDGTTNIYEHIQLDAGKPDEATVVMDSEGNVGIAVYLDDKCYVKDILSDEVKVNEDITTEENCIITQKNYFVDGETFHNLIKNVLLLEGISSSMSSEILFKKATNLSIYKDKSAGELYQDNGMFNLSMDNDNSILGKIIVDSANNKYTLEIHSENIILAPSTLNVSYSYGKVSIFALDGITNISFTDNGIVMFDTSNVVDMNNSFGGLHDLTTLDITSLNTKKATDMSYAFSVLPSLDKLDVSNLNTDNVTNMTGMFSGWEDFPGSYEVIGLEKLNTSNVTNMSKMFSYNGIKLATGETTLDLTNFDTSNVTNMESMFKKSKIPIIDISSFDMTNVNNVDYMFELSLVETIYVRSQVEKDKIESSPEFPTGINVIIK